MHPDSPHAVRRTSRRFPLTPVAHKHSALGSLLPGRQQRGFGLVAAMFLIIVVAGAIASMWRMSVTQTATNNLSLQQSRAYQAARAGIEWGISSALAGNCSLVNPSFTPDGFAEQFRVDVSCEKTEGSTPLPEEGVSTVTFFSITSAAEYASPGTPDHAYRRLNAVVEKED
ncbi:conserved hypothetical protein [Pseudomonas sp. 9Ag]|nr:conserved hypothetical protein [Pseudomonas sp. 9Ag]